MAEVMDEQKYDQLDFEDSVSASAASSFDSVEHVVRMEMAVNQLEIDYATHPVNSVDKLLRGLRADGGDGDADGVSSGDEAPINVKIGRDGAYAA